VVRRLTQPTHLRQFPVDYCSACVVDSRMILSKPNGPDTPAAPMQRRAHRDPACRGSGLSVWQVLLAIAGAAAFTWMVWQAAVSPTAPTPHVADGIAAR
jgi:hypothetical protein